MALGTLGAGAAAAAPDLQQLLVAEEQLLLAEELTGPSGRVHWGGGTAADRALADRVEFCWRAREVYAVIEPDENEVVRLLSPLLRNRDYRVRRNMAVLLGKLGPAAAAAIKPLMDGLNDNALARSSKLDPNFAVNRPVCCEMAEALGKLGDAARPALPKLSAMMTDDERATVRIARALAMIQIDPPNKGAMRELIRILEEDLEKGPDGTAALEATLALADVGPLGREAVPALAKALRHEKFFLRQCAVNALSRIGGTQAVRFLIFACRDPSGMVRRAAVAGLSDMGAAAAPAVPALIKLLDTEGGDEEFPAPCLDVMTMEALGAIGPQAASAIPALEEASQRKEQYRREAARTALKKIRRASAGAWPARVEAAAASAQRPLPSTGSRSAATGSLSTRTSPAGPQSRLSFGNIGQMEN